MKLRPDFEKKCLQAVINAMKEEIVSSEAMLEGDIWIDVVDRETNEIVSVNISWGYSDDEKEVSVVAYPTEEYVKNGKTYLRELTAGDCVIILGDN